MIASLIIAYIICAMVGSSIMAYRGPPSSYGHEPGEVAFILLLAPLGMAYQIGALAREKGK